MAITSQDKAEILKLAVGMFGLSPDSAIFNDLAASYEAHQGDLSALASDLAQTGAFEKKLAGLSDIASKADYLMSNFNLTAGTPVGDAAKAYFEDRLSNGESMDQLSVEVVKYLDDDTKRKAAFDTVKAALDNKEKIAEYFISTGAKAKHLSDLDIVKNVTDDANTLNTEEGNIDDMVSKLGGTIPGSSDITGDVTAQISGISMISQGAEDISIA